HLAGQDVPAVGGPDRRPGSLRRLAGAALHHRVLELPAVRRDLLLHPVAGVVLPLVAPPDLHAAVLLALELLQLVVRASALAVLARGGHACKVDPPRANGIARAWFAARAAGDRW